MAEATKAGPREAVAGAVAAEGFEDWLARVGGTVEARGFLEAWEAHFAEIVRAHRDGTAPDAMLGPSLAALLKGDPDLAGVFAALPPDLAERIERPIEAAEAAAARLGTDFAARLRELLSARVADFPDIVEGDGRPMRCVADVAFRNWGRTVENTPALTFVPATRTGLCNLVKWAAARGRRVRAAGYRHTWGDLYSADGEVLVSMLPLNVVEDLPAAEPPIDPDDQLQGIRIVGTVEEGGVTKALCRVGAATTNEQFREWCLAAGGGDWRWTLPLNVIMIEITFGGSNAPICHGAGLRHRTLSDLVAEVEFVNARGEIQVVRDPDLLKAAAGCFGLLGIVTALTLKLDPMTYASMTPIKPRLALTIPPPEGMAVPAGIDMAGLTPADLRAAWDDFVARCEDDYYAEWFWFAFRPECWVNTWDNDGPREAAVLYPNAVQTFVEEASEYLGQLLNSTVFRLLPGRWQADLLAASAMAALPSGTTIVTPVIEALHFRRGIQNMRVLDMELEIPIPPRADDPTRPDWSVCQKAWWAAIQAVYARADTPMRLALEMRIMGGSGVLMAPQYGNDFGTCSIEILTIPNVDAGEWAAFMQDVADAWCALTGPDGAPLNVRPHWAKQWQGLRLRGQDAVEYLRTVAYRERLPEFRDRIGRIAEAGGSSLAELKARFSNPLLDRLFVDVFADA